MLFAGVNNYNYNIILSENVFFKSVLSLNYFRRQLVEVYL